MHVDRFHSGTGTNADAELTSLFSSAFFMSATHILEAKEGYAYNAHGKR